MSNPQSQHASRLVRRFALIAVGAITVCAVSACYPSEAESSKDVTAKASEAPKKLRIGQPSPEQEISSYKKTAKFVFTPTKVVEGKPEDLDELDEPDKYAGKKVVWVYVNARHVGGDALKEPPSVMSDVNVETASGPGTKFILIGALSSTPKDCNLLNGVKELGTEDVWKKGEKRTVCDPYLVPEGDEVDKVTYSQGYYNEPLRWNVK